MQQKQILIPARPHHLHLNSQASAQPNLSLKTGTFNMMTWRGKTSNIQLQIGSVGVLMILYGKHLFGWSIPNHQTCVVNRIRALI